MNPAVPHFEQFLRYPSIHFLLWPGLLPCRSLSGRHRQRCDSGHHVPKQPPRQMALRQQQPVVPRMLDQSAAESDALSSFRLGRDTAS